MGQRTLYNNQIIDMEIERQGVGYRDRPILLGAAANFPQPTVHAMVTASGSASHSDAQYLPEHHGSAMFYEVTQYNVPLHHHSVDLNAATAGNFYYSHHTPPSCNGVLPVPLNHAVSEHMPPSSNYGATGAPADDYGRNIHFIGEVIYPGKRKVAEGIPGTSRYFNGSTSSPSYPIYNMRHPARVAASFTLPHDHNHLAQGNYMIQHMKSNFGDRSASSWNHGMAMQHIHGTSETVNISMQRYHETASSRNSMQHPPSTNHWHQRHHYLSPHFQGPRSHQINFQSPLPGASHGYAFSALHSTMNASQNSLEIARMEPVPVPATSLGIYHPYRASFTPDATLVPQNLPYLRALPADEVALLETPDYYEFENFEDHHSDMRLDIEDMSYEELLALEEQIGNVSTGLSEETITSQLKTRTINLEENACKNQEDDTCIICRDDYNNLEKIGILYCGHECHADCLKKWLLVKNVCPVCKSEALPYERVNV